MSISLASIISLFIVLWLLWAHYNKWGFINKLLILILFPGVWFSYIDNEFYSGDIIVDYGCLKSREEFLRLSPKYKIETASGMDTYSNGGAKDYREQKYFGRCGRIEYYENILGNKILVGFYLRKQRLSPVF